MKKINNLTILDNYKLSVIFENGESKIFNMNPYLDKGIFKELVNKEYFKQVKNEGYFISWPNEQDLSADTLYIEGR
ncbi:MAG: hypothetical protein FD145_1100 [Candidatus Saganbacteria bacterium]|uniref:DUF2442 domain-containing protein n=1 Tax=Candidatus Saganbacteria bacterium TaxID=2575572 RepID=A0A833NRR2_UNCSA|nr:MAG: hypothetical protein FD145_1100 [Candidatus Saganbacteria bacterium]